MKIEWVGTPNYTAGRGKNKPIAIVNHITAGLMPSCLDWLQNPFSKVSAHYLVTRDGKILQLVKDEDTAWANGIVNKPSWGLYNGSNPNRYTLSIEHEGYSGEELTEKQYQATLWLHRQLCAKWNIASHRQTIIGHYRIDSIRKANCPGIRFPWDRLFTDLEKKEAETVRVESWKINILREAEKIGLIDPAANHEPEDVASKWFVLAVAMNLLKIIRGILN